ncbi:MAG: DUF2189 domain-containing protein [Xanthomonadales bacterium]|nr:DUF2189 domain-containing protein [Xanthomonadales bacterium]
MANTNGSRADINTAKQKQATDTAEDIRPFVAPSRKVGLDAPLRWLKLGWRDFRRIPQLSFGYGLVLTAISVLIISIAWSAHSLVLAIALIGGFFFVGPAIAIGLYSMSRQLENGITPVLMRCLREGRKNFGNEMILAFIFLIIFLIWARAASMVHIFLPSFGATTPADLIKFLSIGSTIGAVFAALVFCIGAFSIPMMMDRNVDAITAVISSVNAVLHNKTTMLLWGLMVVTGIVVGILAGFIGLAVTLPVIGHATWHAYREVIDADAWERSPGIKTD